MADPTDAEREALAPASLLRAWEMGRDAAAAKVLSAQGRWMMGYPDANAAHDVALSRLSDLVRALTPPPDLMQRGLAGDMGAPASAPGELGTSSGERRAPASPRHEWEPIVGLIRKGCCATERCWGEPVWALRAGGVRSHYCAKCKARIDALRVPEEGGDGD